MYGGQYCCRRSYVKMHMDLHRATYVARATTWATDNPVRRRAIEIAHYRKTIDGKRDYWLRRNYGITLAQYNAMLLTQCGVCAVCGQFESKVQRNREQRLSVHHDHSTGQVIALLCQSCNRGMGLLRDSPDLMRRAASLHEGR